MISSVLILLAYMYARKIMPLGDYPPPLPLYNNKGLTDLTRFMAAIIVVIGHLVVFIKEITLLGSCCVSLFFFFSGYGLSHGYLTKANYMRGFIKKRLSKLLIPLISAYCLYCFGYYCIDMDLDLNSVLDSLFTASPFLPYSWFVTEIFIIYFIFYVAIIARNAFSTSCGKEEGLISVSVGVVLLIVFFVIIGFPIWWTCDTFAFIIGLWYRKYEMEFIHFIRKKTTIVMPVGLFLFFISARYDMISSFLSFRNMEWISLYLLSLSFMLCALSVLAFLSIKIKNKRIYGCSYELYLNQGFAILIMGFFSLPRLLSYCLGLCLAIVISYIMNKGNDRVISIIRKL